MNFLKDYMLYDPISMTFWKTKAIEKNKKKQIIGCQELGMRGGFDYKGEKG